MNRKFRLMGLSDEDRLALEQADPGIRTEGAQVLLDIATRNIGEQVMDDVYKVLRDVQGMPAFRGNIASVQAGAIRISRGGGISAAPDGVKKTTIEPDGDFIVGSDITLPATTTFFCFVNDQVYNNETFGAGDLLIGDNTTAQSNVKYDASEGQLQFRYGQTVKAYMDTDGSIKAGAGVVSLNDSGIQVEINDGLTAIRGYQLVDSSDTFLSAYYGTVTAGTNVNIFNDATSIVSGGDAYNTLRAAAEAGSIAEAALTAYVSGQLATAPVIKATQTAAGVGSIQVTNAGVNIPTGKTYDINGSPHTHYSDAEGDPAAIGTAADGTSAYAARRDHVHATANNGVDGGSGFSITGTSGTYQDTGISLSLPSAGIYAIDGTIRGAIQSNVGDYILAKLYNSTDGADVANSETLVIYAVSTGINQNSVSLSMTPITVNGAKTIKLYAARVGGGAFTVSQIPSSADGRTRLRYIKVG